MGFRTTLTTQHYGTRLPAWFHEKYFENYFIDGTLVSSKCELKHYDDFFEKDLQKALIEIDFFTDNIREMHVVALGEDGFVSKIIVTKETIKYFWLGLDDGIEPHWLAIACLCER